MKTNQVLQNETDECFQCRTLRRSRQRAFTVLVVWIALQSIVAGATALVIEHANLIDVVRGTVKPDQSVVILGERIAAVGSGSTFKSPLGSTRLDARGKFLMPGLWDMHVHTLWGEWTNHARLFIANGVTGIRDLNTDLPKSVLAGWRSDIAEADQPGPRFVVAGPILDGPNPVWPNSVRITNPNEARSAVRHWAAEGRDQFKVYEFLPRDAFYAVLDEARRLRKPVTGHTPQAVTATEAAAAGQKCIEHFSHVMSECSVHEGETLRSAPDPDPALTRRLAEELRSTLVGRPDPTFWFDGGAEWFASPPGLEWRRQHAHPGGLTGLVFFRATVRGNGRRLLYRADFPGGVHGFLNLDLSTEGRLSLGSDLLLFDERKAAAAFEVFRRHGTWFCPTFSAKEPSFLPGPQVTNDTRLRFLSSAVREHSGWRWRAASESQRQNDEQINRLIAAANRAGLPLLCGTDALYPWVYPGFSVHDELDLFVRAGGMTAAEALRTATVNPARFLARERDLGTVAKGKLADLILLDANPLDNIRNTRQIAAVVANGKLYERSALNQMLRDVEAATNPTLQRK